MEELKRTDYPAWQAFVNGGLNVDLEHFQRSVVDTLEEIVATHANQRVAAFCHGGVINAGPHTCLVSRRGFSSSRLTLASVAISAREAASEIW